MLRTMWTAKIKPGRLPELLEAGLAHVAASRREPGCKAFDFHVDAYGGDTLVTVEYYDDQAALDAHRQTPHFQAFIGVMQATVESFTMDWIEPPNEARPMP